MVKFIVFFMVWYDVCVGGSGDVGDGEGVVIDGVGVIVVMWLLLLMRWFNGVGVLLVVFFFYC